MKLNIDMNKIMTKIKNNLNPNNIWQKIIDLPLMQKVYYSKIITGLIVGITFGFSNFRNWPAGLTLFGIFIAISTLWFLLYRNKNTGIKIRSYYTSAMFQYFIIAIAMWTLIINLMYVPKSDWQYGF